MKEFKREWYRIPDAPDGNGRAHYTTEIQKNTDVIGIMRREAEALTNEKYVHLGTHCGYCDGELSDVSTFSLIRGKECQALCSEEMKSWVRDNGIELVSFRQIAEEAGLL